MQPKRFPFQPAQRAGISLHKEPQIAQTAQFLHVLCLSAPALGVINMVTSCFQALDKALHSLTIPDHYGPAQRRAVYSSRNPTELALGMQGVFTVQPAVEWLLCVIFLSLYARRATHGKQAQSTRGNPLHAVGKLTARPFLPAEPVRAHSRPAAGARLFPFGFLLHTGAPFAVRRLTPRPKSE